MYLLASERISYKSKLIDIKDTKDMPSKSSDPVTDKMQDNDKGKNTEGSR